MTERMPSKREMIGNIGSLFLHGTSAGLIIGVEEGQYKVLFSNTTKLLPHSNYSVACQVSFKTTQDTQKFKRGTTLTLRKSYPNSHNSLRLGNKGGSDWFSKEFYEIYLGSDKITLGIFKKPLLDIPKKELDKMAEEIKSNAEFKRKQKKANEGKGEKKVEYHPTIALRRSL